MNTVFIGKPVNAITAGRAASTVGISLLDVINLIRCGKLQGLIYNRMYWISPAGLDLLREYKKGGSCEDYT